MTKYLNKVTNPVCYLIVLLMSIVFVSACSKPTEAVLPIASRVLALGDSLTAGYGVASNEAWSALLANQTGWEILNGGVSGDTSGEALLRLPALLARHEPVLVLVALGGNDMLQGVPQEETLANLRQVFSLIKAQGATPVLLGIPKPSVAGAVFRNLSAADFYGEVAAAEQVLLFEDAIADVLSDPQLKGDPLHPNAAGHMRLAEILYAKLQSVGYVN